MRFIDSNIFLHAFLIPRRPLTVEEQKVKEEAKHIIEKVEENEEVAITTAHLSEIINIVEAGLGLQKSLSLLAWMITSRNIRIYPAAKEDYEEALSIAKEKNVSANDALAYICMKANGMEEIYSFDKHFDQFEDITRLPKP
ncbi:type II toxin-antitoxin system VapC family toxin [Candidatus Bathyarchaeota archaeon]|nr:type II toxin-antitoxin system VapC family toxin [Candidatus Bathyarchaeota archaeon]